MRRGLFLGVAGVLVAAGVLGGALVWRLNQAGRETANGVRGELIPETPAPDFTLAARNGDNISLGDLRGKYVVLFFSGGLTCLPCIAQIEELNRDGLQMDDDAVAFSIVPDPQSSWQKAAEASSSLARANPLFDVEGKVFHDYEALNISSLMRGGAHMAHTYFVINREGMIVTVADDPAMGVRTVSLASLLSELEKIEAKTQ